MAFNRGKKRKAKPATEKPALLPGITDNPVASVLMVDIVIRTGSYVLRHMVEKKFLKGRYGKQTAKALIKNRSIGQTLASIAVAKIATRSLPGAAVVGTGLLAKALYDRGKARRTSQTALPAPSPTSSQD